MEERRGEGRKRNCWFTATWGRRTRGRCHRRWLLPAGRREKGRAYTKVSGSQGEARVWAEATGGKLQPDKWELLPPPPPLGRGACPESEEQARQSNGGGAQSRIKKGSEKWERVEEKCKWDQMAEYYKSCEKIGQKQISSPLPRGV